MNKIRSIFVVYHNKIIFISLIIIGLIGIFCFSIINNRYNAGENVVSESIIEKTEEKTDKTINLTADEPGKIKVDVKGAVKNPGVYEVGNDARVIDAINVAGGLNKNAYTRYLNLSKRLKDEYVILVNTENEIKEIQNDIKKAITSLSNKEECICETISNVCVEEKSLITNDLSPIKDEKVENNSIEEKLNTFVNINTASLEELSTLNGIGVSIAQRILDYRNINGLFTKTEDIKNVSGIGEKLYEKIKDNITI